MNMDLLLFCGILAVIFIDAYAVHPGDPFPTDLSESKKITSEDIINDNEIQDPHDDETPWDSFVNDDNDNEDSTDFVTSTTIKSTTIPPRFRHKHVDRKTKTTEQSSSSTTTDPPITESFDDTDHPEETFSKPQQSLTLSPGKPINAKNLIKVGRWKFIDLRSKSIRYWYEPEGGQMGNGWIFDGFLFQAYNKSAPDTEPVYAFHSETRAVWTNTVQMDPKSPIIGNDQWIPDGVSFYAYRTSFNSTELQPVLRYWNKLKTGATDLTETRITYLTTKPVDGNEEEELGWTFDSILFYALPIED